MGPTEEDVAHSLCNTVPVNSVLITGEDQKPDILREVAKQNGTRFIKSDESSIQKKNWMALAIWNIHQISLLHWMFANK